MFGSSLIVKFEVFLEVCNSLKTALQDLQQTFPAIYISLLECNLGPGRFADCLDLKLPLGSAGRLSAPKQLGGRLTNLH